MNKNNTDTNHNGDSPNGNGKVKFSSEERVELCKWTLRHMRRFAHEFFPDGMLSPEGGYFYVDRLGIKISLDMGGYFVRYGDEYLGPFDNPLTLYMIAKRVPLEPEDDEDGNFLGMRCRKDYYLAKSALELGNWLYGIEHGEEKEEVFVPPPRDEARAHRSLKALCHRLLFLPHGELREVKDSSRALWKKIRVLLTESLGEKKARAYFRKYPELAFATDFHDLLRRWDYYEDRKCFSVEERHWAKRKIFILTRRRKGVPPPLRRSREQRHALLEQYGVRQKQKSIAELIALREGETLREEEG